MGRLVVTGSKPFSAGHQQGARFFGSYGSWLRVTFILQITSLHRDGALPALEVTRRSYYRARYYDPTSGRFVSEDPIGFHGGASSFYGYVGNNTLNFGDPGGKCVKEIHRCAASLAEEYSISSLLHIPIIATNTVADVSKLIVGPEPGTDPAAAKMDRVDQYAGLGADLASHVSEHVVSEVGTGWDLVHEASTGLLKFTPETIGDLAIPVAKISVKSAFGILGAGKLVYDAEIYLLAVGVCIYTQ